MRKSLSVLLFVCLILFAGLLATPGAQEPTARRKGYTVTHESGGAWGRVVALQPDGGIVLGGCSKNGKDRSTDRRHLKERRRGARPCPTAYRPY